ncbi:MAG: hypothetical protein MUC91_07435 [Verrucomicrobia bacterium]|nr:hypothetical protein [Verrucomicrobiota bacterium]
MNHFWTKSHRLTGPFLAACAVLLCSCASTKVKDTWVSPSYTGGPVGKVAILAVEERGIVRTGFENRLARELGRTGQPVVLTYELLSLSEIKEDRQAAAARLREAGAEVILITRLVSSEADTRSVRAGEERYAPVTTGFSPGLPYGPYGWYGYYELAYQDMSTVWGSQNRKVRLECSLFDLADGQRLWACLTETALKENADRVAEVDPWVSEVVGALRKDGLVK